jgi:putative addiction module killer protein
VFEISHYLTPEGKDIFLEWQLSLRDTNARIAIDRRINRIELGNFGDHKFCRDGVWELRIDFGPGYRVYYAIAGSKVVLLLSGGDKGTQTTDINRACEEWKDWQRRAEQ